jgi:hypothetical protein
VPAPAAKAVAKAIRAPAVPAARRSPSPPRRARIVRDRDDESDDDDDPHSPDESDESDEGGVVPPGIAAMLAGAPALAPASVTYTIMSRDAILAAETELKAWDDVRITDHFWNIIARLGWKGAGMGHIKEADCRAIKQIIEKMSGVEKIAFRNKYIELFQNMRGRLTADGMFERNGIRSLSDQAKVVSHVIALGKETYGNLYADLEFLQILIEGQDCQNFNVVLPEEWRM